MVTEKQKSGDILIVSVLETRLDARIAVDFKNEIATVISEGQSKIVLDLEKVEFIDSSGLGAIVSVLKLLGRDGDLVIANVQKKVMSLFKLTRMDRVFKMFDNREKALASLQ